MHILFTRFPLESAEGGAENQTQWLWEGLIARGHTVQFLGSCPVLLERAKTVGISSLQLDIGPPPVTKMGAVSFLWRQKKMQSMLIDAVKNVSPKPDAIVMLSLSEKLLLTEWAVSQGMRVYWVEHDRIGPWLTKNPWLSTLRTLSQKVTTICVSDLSRQKYIDLGWQPEHVVSIPNGVPEVPPPSATPYTRGAHPAATGLHIGCLARLSKEKGIDVLIAAIRDIPEATLSIVGRGPEETYLRTLIHEDAQRHGTERITLTWKINDVHQWMQGLDIFVLPSTDHEPFGLAPVEAMRAGVATIVTDACGVATYLQHGTDACIVKAGDEQALTSAIRQLSDPVKRAAIAAQGASKAASTFSLESMIDKYVTILANSR